MVRVSAPLPIGHCDDIAHADQADMFVCYEQPFANKGTVAENNLYCPNLHQRFPLVLIWTR